jgi:hypothetical protein
MDRRTAKEHNTMFARFLCKKNGCDEKLAKLHLKQMVEEAWNPHPSPEFVAWWQTQPGFRTDSIDAVRARNCKVFVDQYKEAVQLGLATLPIDYPTAAKPLTARESSP